MPPLSVGAAKGSTGIGTTAAVGVGWIYIPATGQINANTTGTELDARGVAYNT